MLAIALFEPKIAPNTGNIIRLAANNGCSLHLIEPLGFDLSEKKLRRAGLDYHDLALVRCHSGYESFVDWFSDARIFACSTKGKRRYDQVKFERGDVVLFGSETSGLPAPIMNRFKRDHLLTIPMRENSRSLNLSNAVAVITYEAWRQTGFSL